MFITAKIVVILTVLNFDLGLNVLCYSNFVHYIQFYFLFVTKRGGGKELPSTCYNIAASELIDSSDKCYHFI